MAKTPDEKEWQVLITGAGNSHQWSRIRVPGGWVYRHYGNPPQIVFVPDAEGQPKVEPHDPEWDDTNGDHPLYTLVEWTNEVGGGNTRLGYRQWVGHQIEGATRRDYRQWATCLIESEDDEGMAGEGLDLLHGQRDQSGGVEPDEDC